MSRTKRITLCLLAAFALSAALVSTASAASPAWWVNGSLLAAGAKEAIAESTTVTSPFVVKEGTFDVQCASAKVEKGYIEGENKAAAKALIFGECKDITQPHCEVAPITTKPLSVVLEGTTGKFKLNFKPTTGTELETVHFSGAECSFTSAVIEGSMACNYPGVETESLEHELEFTATSGSELEVFGKPAELKGIDHFWLASGKKWSAK